MKKKILFVLLGLFTFFALNISVKAENVKNCIYKSSDYDMTLAFDINGDGSTTRAALSGSDASLFSNEPVVNWRKKAVISFIGIDYFKTSGKCPQSTILIKYYGDAFGATRHIPIAPFKHDVLYVSNQDRIGTDLDDLKKYYKNVVFGNRIVDGYPIVLNLDKERGDVIIDDDGDITSNEKIPTSCIDYKLNNDARYEGTCQNNKYFACVWNETKFGNYCNVDNLIYVSCGDTYDIPYQVPEIISFAVNLLKIGAPIVLIIVSIISLVKALASSKEDEIKKAQGTLIKRLIAAALVFFVIAIVQFVILKVADDSETGNIESCLSCFLNNDCDGSAYYKTNVGATHDGVHNTNGDYLCTYFNGTTKECE